MLAPDDGDIGDSTGAVAGATKRSPAAMYLVKHSLTDRGRSMRPSFIFATFATSVAAACAVVVAPAGIASAEQSAQETIGLLEAEGYDVNVDRVGSGTLDQCVVTSVRNPQTQTKIIRVYKGKKDSQGNRDFDLVEIVTSRSISVSLDCSR
jgi:hypothetical protein